MLEMQRIQQLEMDEERSIHQLEKQRVELNYRRRGVTSPSQGQSLHHAEPWPLSGIITMTQLLTLICILRHIIRQGHNLEKGHGHLVVYILIQRSHCPAASGALFTGLWSLTGS
jgi:hypothetical protein